MAHEPTIALNRLLSLLREDVVIMSRLTAVYARTVPAAPVMPYAVVTSNGGTDYNTAGDRAFSQPTFAVKVVSIDYLQDEKANRAMDSIDTRLQNYQGTDEVTGASILIKSLAPMPEYTENNAPAPNFRHAGRYWRVTVSVPAAS